MARPLLLDLFCGAGGAAMGYHRAGFDVLGVDIRPQPRYPFRFVQADALQFLASTPLTSFAAIHASPPCQRYSRMTMAVPREDRADLLGPTRDLLQVLPQPWVIENVPGAPMRPDHRLCGCIFGLGVQRERWFETSWRAFDLRQPCQHAEPPVDPQRSFCTRWYQQHGRVANRSEVAAAFGIDWMTSAELRQAIPPAYTEYIGRQLIDEA